MRPVRTLLAALLAIAAVAFAGELVDQGAPGNQGAWPVKCVSGCSAAGGGSGSSGGTTTIDGGVLSAVSWVDGGYINATVTNFPATQPVSGAVSVSGTVGATQSGAWSMLQSGSWTVSLTPGTVVTLDGGALSSVTQGGPWNVLVDGGSINVVQSTSPWVVSGTVTTSPPSNASSNVSQFGGSSVVTGTGTAGAGVPRVTVSNDSSVVIDGGTVNVVESGPWHVVIDGGLLNVLVDGGSINVVQTTSPWVISGAVTQGGAWNVGAGLITVDGGFVGIDNFPATQTVAGTVTANQGGAPWSVSESGPWNVLVDGGSVTVLQGTTPWVVSGGGGSSASVVTIDGGILGAVSWVDGGNINAQVTGTVAVSNFPGTQPVSGTVTANQGGAPWSVAESGPWNVLIDGGSVNVVQTTSPWVVSGTVTTSPPANASTNVAQFGGSSVVTGTGTAGAGVPRVTVSNDSSVVIDGGTVAVSNFPATQVVNQGFINGTTISQGNGPSGLGTQRVSVANDTVISVTLDGGSTNIANTVTVQGTVSVGNFPTTQGVNVAQFGGSNVVTGTGTAGAGVPRVTVSNDSSVVIDGGTVNAAQSGTWSVTATQATAANLNATVVGTKSTNAAAPSSNNVGVLPGLANAAAPTLSEGDQVLLSTDLSGNLRVTGGGGGAEQQATGTLGALNAALTISSMAGVNSIGVAIGGSPGLSGTVVAEYTFDGSSWVAAGFVDNAGLTFSSSVVGAPITVTYKSVPVPEGAAQARIRVSAYTSGSCTAYIRGNQLSPNWMQALTVTAPGNSGTVAAATQIAGYDSQATTPRVPEVNAASTAAIATDQSLVVALHPSSPLPAGSNNVGSITNITGTVSLPTGAATASNQTTLGSQTSKINDGTNTGTIKAASTAAAAADTSLVVGFSPNSPLPTGSNTIGSITNISGTVSLPTGAATASNQTTLGSQTTKINDGTNTAAVKAASTTPATTDDALVVTQSPNGGNPCQNPTATVQSVAGATTGTTSTQIIAISGTNKIYVCSVSITGVSGTTPTFSLQYGTGTNCASGTTKFLGSWTTTANTIYTFTTPVFVTPAGQAICYLDGGTTPVQNFNVTYVQAP